MTTDRLADLLAKRNEIIGKMSIVQLIEAFAHTDELDLTSLPVDDAAAIAEVRGWIMDELEKRDKGAFDSWLDSSDMTVGDLSDAFAGVS